MKEVPAKITQIAVGQISESPRMPNLLMPVLYALDENGDVWYRHGCPGREWYKIQDLEAK